MAKKYVRDNLLPLSQFGVLVAQLESIVASAAQKPPEPLLCFDLLSDLISAIADEPKVSLALFAVLFSPTPFFFVLRFIVLSFIHLNS